MAEEQGRRDGGETNVGASILLSAGEEAGRGRQENNSKQEVIAHQEAVLSRYATDNKLWNSESDFKNTHLQLPSGFESKVYRSPDGKTVTKFINYRILDNTPQSFIDNRISLYNHLFPEAKYTLKGFAKDKETGQFQFVVEQPYVQGKLLDFNNEKEVEKFDSEMQKSGLINLLMVFI